MTIKTRHTLAALAVLTLAATAAHAQRDLTVVSWGGAYQDGQKEVFFKPFNATGTKLLDEAWDGGLGVLRTKIKGGNNTWDVVQVEADELEVGCDEGLYEKLDVNKIGGAARYLPGHTLGQPNQALLAAGTIAFHIHNHPGPLAKLAIDQGVDQELQLAEMIAPAADQHTEIAAHDIQEDCWRFIGIECDHAGIIHRHHIGRRHQPLVAAGTGDGDLVGREADRDVARGGRHPAHRVHAAGVRAHTAAQMLRNNGFSHVKVYPGGAYFYEATHR